MDRSWRRSIGERVIDSVGGFTSAAVSARKRNLDLATARGERGAHEQVQIEKDDAQMSKWARIGGRKCQDATTRVIGLCPGVGRRIAGVVSWRPLPKRDGQRRQGARRLKASYEDRQAPLLHDNGDAAAPSTRCAVRLPN